MNVIDLEIIDSIINKKDEYETSILQFIENIYFLSNEYNKNVQKKKIYISTLEKELGVSTGYISRIENSIKKSKVDSSVKPWNPSANFVLAAANFFQIYVDIIVNIDLASITSSELQIIRLLSSLAKATYDNKISWEISSVPQISINELENFDPLSFESLTCSATLPNSSSLITIKRELGSGNYTLFLTTSLGDCQEIYSYNTTSDTIKYAFVILARSINHYFKSSFPNSDQLKVIKKIAKVEGGYEIFKSYQHTSQSQDNNNGIFIDKYIFFNNLSFYCIQKGYTKSFLEKQIGVSQGFISRAQKESYEVEPSFRIIYKSSKLLNKDIYSLCNLSCKNMLDNEYHFISFLHGLIKKTQHHTWLKTFSNDVISVYMTKLSKSDYGIYLKYDKESDVYSFYMSKNSSDKAQLVAMVSKWCVNVHTISHVALGAIENSINKVPSSKLINESLKKSEKKSLDDIITSLW